MFQALRISIFSAIEKLASNLIRYLLQIFVSPWLELIGDSSQEFGVGDIDPQLSSSVFVEDAHATKINSSPINILGINRACIL